MTTPFPPSKLAFVVTPRPAGFIHPAELLDNEMKEKFPVGSVTKFGQVARLEDCLAVFEDGSSIMIRDLK